LTQPLTLREALWLAGRFAGDTANPLANSRALEPTEKAHVERMVRAVEQSLTPAPRPAVVMALTRLAAHFWNDRGEAQWKIVFEDYADDLADYPADVIGAGIREYRQAAKWWPKSAELIELMRPKLLKRQLQLAQLRKLLEAKPETDREAERERLKNTLGPAWADWWNVPVLRRYTGTPEDFAAGWNAATDKAAFCESWGQREESAA
jgi:hypothetical protein